MKKILTFLLFVGALTSVFAQTRTLTTDKDFQKIFPSQLNLQPQRYAVFEIQIPMNTTWSDIELKGTITNFDNQSTVLTAQGTTLKDYTNKVLWNKKTDAQKEQWLETYTIPALRPSNWNDMELVEKDAFVFAHTGPYIFFFGTCITYDTHYIFGKNDGELKVYFASTNAFKDFRSSGSHDPRRYVEFVVPQIGDTFKKGTAGTTMKVTGNKGSRVFEGFPYYITATGTGQPPKNTTDNTSANGLKYYTNSNLSDDADKLQKQFSINNLYTYQSISQQKSGKLNSVIVIVYYGDPNEPGIGYTEKVYRTVMQKYCTPKNRALKWCYILCSSNAFEMSFNTTPEGAIEARRVYRAIRPREWINYDEFVEYQQDVQ